MTVKNFRHVDCRVCAMCKHFDAWNEECLLHDKKLFWGIAYKRVCDDYEQNDEVEE